MTCNGFCIVWSLFDGWNCCRYCCARFFLFFCSKFIIICTVYEHRHTQVPYKWNGSNLSKITLENRINSMELCTWTEQNRIFFSTLKSWSNHSGEVPHQGILYISFSILSRALDPLNSLSLRGRNLKWISPNVVLYIDDDKIRGNRRELSKTKRKRTFFHPRNKWRVQRKNEKLPQMCRIIRSLRRQ